MVTEIFDRKKQILNEARTLFARLGFKKCTTEDIARACGLTKAAIYHYYENKESIFTEVIRNETSILLSEISKAIHASLTPADKLKAYIITRFEKIISLKNLHDVSLAVGNDVDSIVAKCRDPFTKQETDLLVSIIEEGQKKGMFINIHAQAIVKMLLASFKGIESSIGSFEDPQLIVQGIHDLLEVLCRGLLVEQKA